MYDLKLLVLSLLFLAKSSRSFAPIGVLKVTFNFPFIDHSSKFLRLKTDDLLGLDDVSVAESTKDTTQILDVLNYDTSTEEGCPIPTYNGCDLEGGYEIPVEEMAESTDIARERARLDGMCGFIFASGLTSTTSISICLGVNSFSHTSLEALSFDYITVLSATLSEIFGIYSTVVFSFCVCYGRTAVGMNNDKGYEEFMRNTECYRSQAARACLASVCLFLFEIVLVSSEQIPEPIRYPYLAILSIASIFLSRNCAKIVEEAVPIFANMIK